MKAFILCAGKGTRLLPLTENLPKPLLPLLDRPFFDHVVSMLSDAGVTEFGAVTGHLKEAFFQNYSQEGYAFIDQEQQLGTGHAILQLENHVRKGEPFIAAAGDNLFPSHHVREMIEKIKEPAVNGVVSLIEMPPSRIVNQMATVKLGKNYQILEIKEKPANEEEVYSPYGTAAIWALKESIFPALKGSNLSSRGELEIQSGIQSLIDQGKIIKGVPLPEERYIQLTSIEDLYHLNIRFLEEKRLDNWVHDSVTVMEETKMNHSVIMAGCMVKGDITLERVVALPGAVIRSSASNSLIFHKQAFAMPG